MYVRVHVCVHVCVCVCVCMQLQPAEAPVCVYVCTSLRCWCETYNDLLLRGYYIF